MKNCIVNITTTIAVILSLLCLNLSSVRADDSDIFGANIEPNVLLLFDSSGSMDSNIDSTIYDPSTTYSSGTKQTAKVYKPNNNNTNYSVYKQTVDEVPDANARTALNLNGYWMGQIGGSTVSLFLGNYLNYRDCTTCTVQETKTAIAKRVYTNILSNVEGVRFGVMSFRPNGGDLIAPIGTDTTTMINAVNSIAPEHVPCPPCTGTPLGDQLYDAGRYFKGTYDYGGTFASPIQYECQPTFVIMMSDGLHNWYLRDVRDEATLRLKEDHLASLTGTQNVILHTLGFKTDSTANDVLITAAANGGGSFFYAENAAELELALQEAIRRIVEAVFTFATPVVPTTSATGSTRAYIAAVQSDPEINFWRGYLKAYDRDTDGTIRLNPDGTPDATYLAWEAGDVLTQKTAANRKIYMEKIKPLLGVFSGARVEFTTTTVVPYPVVGASSNAEKNEIVNFIRGVDVYDEDADSNITEDRAWKLGDIFHSTPVLVSPPLLPITDSSYVAFRAAQADRTTVLIVGANDGMVHAFAESADTDLGIVAGEELWAYVPPTLLPKLRELTTILGGHPYFVDSSPIATDIKIGSDWKTIVVFGLRRGGTSYFALDVTDTTDPYMLWKNADGAGIGSTDSEMGETWSEPAIGKIKWTDGSDKYVAFVGGGYYTGENNLFGKAVYMIDLETGTTLAKYYNDGTSDDRQYMNFSLASNPTAVDLDHDGYIDRVYIGDVGGQMWKFEPTLVPGITTPATYTYEYIDKDSLVLQSEFTLELKNNVTDVDLFLASSVANPLVSPPADCTPDCFAYRYNGNDLETENHANHIGYVGGLNASVYGSGTLFTNMTLISTNGGSTASTFTLPGKRLFDADPSQANPPPVGEYYPAQAIYGAPSVASDDQGNIWVSFGTGDRNRPLNASTNRFYGIKDNTTMDNTISSLTESALLEIDATVSTVSTSVQGWYFTLSADEKVLAQADTFNNTVFFTTFTPASVAVCGGGGGTAKLYAVQLTSGMAAMDFSTGDALASTSGSVLKSTVIGSGIPSKPAVMIDPNGNPSVVTGTTSQQISSVAVPPVSTKQLLGWREVF